MAISRGWTWSWGAALLCGALCAGCGSLGGAPRSEGGVSADGASRDGASRDGASRDGASRDGASRDGALLSDGGRAEAGADRTGGTGVCTQTSIVAAPNPPDILIVMDRSGSMADVFGQGQSKWTVLSQAINSLVASTETTVNWGLKLYGDDDMCGVNAGAAVRVGPSSASAIAAALAPVAASGETPTETAIESAVAYLQGLSDPDPKYLLLASGGQMGCGPGLDPSADDSTGAESAVSAAAGAGFPTFVLGVVDPTSEAAATGTLNQIAIVGNEAQQNSSTSFYRVTDLSVLTEVTSARTSFGIGCTIALETSVAGAVLSVSAITTAGTTVAIPQDAANGWSYDAGGRNLILNGSVCTALQASAYSVVSLRYDCGG
jgi:hypothetical protein